MLILMLVIAVIFALFETVYLKRIQKHDRYIFEFCDLRRDMITYLYEERNGLSRSDYIQLREILNTNNVTIHNYKDSKHTMFNFRRFIDKLRVIENKKSRVESNVLPEVKVFQVRLVHIVFDAFLAYTPFLKSEVIIKVLYFITSNAVKAGFKSLVPYEKDLEFIRTLGKEYKAEQAKFC
ncbi:hypothetical protein [Psychrobacter sp. DM4]|uniref:hypothetical protein n=1 Tax=Psychrobacter sp. DM4 TaxID=3440637 RepID=UPI003F5074A4